MSVVTISERKRLETARLVQAATDVSGRLRQYARATGGRFIVFGSFVSGQMRYDSDLDLLVDFPAEAAADAWRFAEDACRQASIEADIHDAATSRPCFVQRVEAEGLVLD